MLSLFAYIVISGAGYHFSVDLPSDVRNTFFWGYTLSTQFFLYIMDYRALRNMSYYLCWVLIATAHFVLYMNFKDDMSFQMVNGSAIKGLRNTIFLLFIFQVLRFANLKIQHQELVAPSVSGIDLFDSRKVNFLDSTSFLIYMGAMVVLLFLI